MYRSREELNAYRSELDNLNRLYQEARAATATAVEMTLNEVDCVPFCCPRLTFNLMKENVVHGERIRIMPASCACAHMWFWAFITSLKWDGHCEK